MTDAELRATMSDRTALALTMWGEARGEPVEGLIAVGCVIRNRVARFREFEASEGSFRAVCLAPKQFSCWIPAGGTTNYSAAMGLLHAMADGAYAGEDPSVEQCLFLAEGVISGQLLDNTAGATSYYAPAAMHPAGRVPFWAQDKPFAAIGTQRFYRT